MIKAGVMQMRPRVIDVALLLVLLLVLATWLRLADYFTPSLPGS
jgi:hypothetical protein